MAGLKEALDTLKNAVGDLASLEVQTYSGSIELYLEQVDAGNGTKKAKMKDFETLLADATDQSKNLQLRAVTKMMFDGDAINLVPDGDFSGDIEKVHSAAVKAGIDTRHGLLELFGGMVGLKPGK